MAPIGQQSTNGTNLTNQQIATLLNILSQSGQTNPSSANFSPSAFSSLHNQSTQNLISTALQQNAQQNEPNYLIVRSVNDPSEIGPQEVTMGVLNVFPDFSGEKIYVKSWNKQGSIENNVFVLQKEEDKVEKTENEEFTALEKRVKALETALAKMKKQKSTKASPKSAVKKKPPVEIIEEETEVSIDDE